MEIQELKNEAEAEKSPDISALEEDKEKLEEDLTEVSKSILKLVSEVEDNNNETKKLRLIISMLIKNYYWKFVEEWALLNNYFKSNFSILNS